MANRQRKKKKKKNWRDSRPLAPTNLGVIWHPPFKIEFAIIGIMEHLPIHRPLTPLRVQSNRRPIGWNLESPNTHPLALGHTYEGGRTDGRADIPQCLTPRSTLWGAGGIEWERNENLYDIHIIYSYSMVPCHAPKPVLGLCVSFPHHFSKTYLNWELHTNFWQT